MNITPYSSKHSFERISISMLLLMAIMSGTQVRAQLNPLGAAYFQNQYLLNPAVAGLEQGLNLNLGVRQQWSSIPGTPKTQSLTADYGISSKNVGLGINLDNDKAGLQIRTRAMGTFAYHIPLSAATRLSFGLSLGFMNDRIENNYKGDAGDQLVSRYNQRDMYFDGDLGTAFTTEKLMLQASIPNLKNFFKKDDGELGVDRSTFMGSASYKIGLPNFLDGMVAEPKVCFRGVHGYDNILDAGANFNFANKRMNVLAMYHSSNSATVGMGVIYKAISIMGLYTTETAALRTYANGSFELNLKVKAF